VDPQPYGEDLAVFDFIEPGREMVYTAWTSGDDWAARAHVSEDGAEGVVVRRIDTFRRLTAEGSEQVRHGTESHRVRVLQPEYVLGVLDSQGFDSSLARAYGAFRLPDRRVAAFATKRGT